MDLKQAIYGRRAVREYTAEPVADATLRALIEAAVQAPSAVNQQPWSFTVVRDKALLAQISREAKAHMLKKTPAALLSHHFQEILGDSAFNVFYDAPALVVIASLADSAWAVEDCALAAQNLMLAATEAGLGSCWIGFAQGWLATPEGKAALGLPDAYRPVAPIILGHPKRVPPPVARNEPRIRWIGP
ncbi:MAG TPA: nitroreductase [Xanthobacteraceae bacterium]|nr:nitroreductase [Xanthobacteraceae bacterium]